MKVWMLWERGEDTNHSFELFASLESAKNSKPNLTWKPFDNGTGWWAWESRHEIEKMEVQE